MSVEPCEPVPGEWDWDTGHLYTYQVTITITVIITITVTSFQVTPASMVTFLSQQYRWV